MNLIEARNAAEKAARAAGALMRRHLAGGKRANLVTQHDIKLELDVQSQKLIERTLHAAFPEVSLLGEEGMAGDADAPYRWVVDPIDGTVNFAYGIPHACVSIALQARATDRRHAAYRDGYETLVGVVFDPFCVELWTAIRGQPALLNGRKIHASRRRQLQEAIVCLGFAKSRESLDHTLPYFNWLVPKVRKIRMMGSAALALTYVATGRFDGYVERGISIWDVAAGGLIVQCAGGEFWIEPLEAKHSYRLVASNGLLRKKLSAPA
jgi:myo-inositol-1(or 4)-monophosphatase